jgi:general secretion pathway protein B
MSLILEALKKAERQHKLGEVPRINPDNEQPATTGGRRLGWLMMTLLALTLIGIGIYLGSNGWFSPQQPKQPPQASRSEEASGDARQRPEPGAVASMQPREAVAASGALPAESDPQAYSEPPPEPVSRTEVVEPPQPLEVEVPPPPPPPRPPRPLNEMPSGFVAHLPEMNIDIHSYDKNPAKRYVLINMEKYHEGDYLAEGPRIIEILPDGAVMEHMGERFILPIGNQ